MRSVILIHSAILSSRSSGAFTGSFLQSDASPTAVLRDELDAGFLKGFPKFSYRALLGRERAGLSFEPFYAGQRYA